MSLYISHPAPISWSTTDTVRSLHEDRRTFRYHPTTIWYDPDLRQNLYQLRLVNQLQSLFLSIDYDLVLPSCGYHLVYHDHSEKNSLSIDSLWRAVVRVNRL